MAAEDKSQCKPFCKSAVRSTVLLQIEFGEGFFPARTMLAGSSWPKTACSREVVSLMEDAGGCLFWQTDAGRLLSLDAALGESSLQGVAHAMALWGDRWSFDPSLLGARQRAALRRRALRLVRSAKERAFAPESLSPGSRVLMPWVWYELAGGAEVRRVGSAWLRAGDSLRLRSALGSCQAGGFWLNPDFVGRAFNAEERFLPGSMSQSMESFLLASVEGPDGLLLWLPRELPPREKEVFLGSVVWVLSLGSLAPFSGEGPLPSGAVPGSLPLVGGWPCRLQDFDKGGGDSLCAHAAFLSRREWALSLMSYAEVSRLMEGV